MIHGWADGLSGNGYWIRNWVFKRDMRPSLIRETLELWKEQIQLHCLWMVYRKGKYVHKRLYLLEKKCPRFNIIHTPTTFSMRIPDKGTLSTTRLELVGTFIMSIIQATKSTKRSII